MQKPSIGRFEINLNTVLNFATLVGMIAGGGYLWANTTRDIDDIKAWRTGHEGYHKERLGEVKANEARTEERFRGLESEVRKIDNITYRLTVTEQSTTTTATAIKELQTLLSQQSGDLKVVREILQRIEAAQRNPAR